MALDTENRASLANLNEQRGVYQKQRLLAPAVLSRSNSNTPYKRPSNAYYLGTTLDSNNPAVVRRNARERNRVKQVNNGFTNLRQHLPAAIVADLSNGRRGIGPGAHKKLSKVDTLRMAVEYIRRLKDVIEEVDRSDTSSVGSYSTCGSSTSSSPPPTMNNQSSQLQDMGLSYFPHHSPQSSYSMMNYSSSFQTQPMQQNNIISPVNSCSSPYNSAHSENQLHAAFGLRFEENSNTSADDDELLDYISLWQDEL